MLKAMNWIKIDESNKPPIGEWVICSDGFDWDKCKLSSQREFTDPTNKRLVYKEITHFAIINLP